MSQQQRNIVIIYEIILSTGDDDENADDGQKVEVEWNNSHDLMNENILGHLAYLPSAL